MDICGGGAGGVSVDYRSSIGGGGAGAAYKDYPLSVVKGQTYTITVGQAGAIGNDGGDSKFDSLLLAPGGKKPYKNSKYPYWIGGPSGGPGGQAGEGCFAVTNNNGSVSFYMLGDGGSGIFGSGGRGGKLIDESSPFSGTPPQGYGAGGNGGTTSSTIPLPPSPGTGGLISVTW